MENQYYNQDNSKYLDGNLIELCKLFIITGTRTK